MRMCVFSGNSTTWDARPKVLGFLWIIGLVMGLTTGLMGCNGCQRQSVSSETTMQRYLPRTHYGLVLLPLLSDLPTRLNQLLLRFEGPQPPGQAPTGQLRHYLQEFRNALGLDILDAQSFAQHGIQASGTMLAMRVRLDHQKAFVLAVPVTHPGSFETLVKNVAAQRFIAHHVKRHPSERGTITTLYRKRQNILTEELTYSFFGNVGFVVRPVAGKKSSPPKTQKTADGVEILKYLYDLSAEQSLTQDPAFQKVLQRWKGKAQAVLYMPVRPPKKLAIVRVVAPSVASMQGLAANKAASAPGQSAKPRPSLPPATQPVAQMASPPSPSPPQPDNKDAPLLQSLIQQLRQYNPFSESTTALSWGSEGLQIDAGLPQSPARIRRLQKMVPTTGEPEKLVHLLNQRAIFGFKLSLNPQELPGLVARALSTSQTPITPMQLYTALKTHTGLDLKQDLLPVLSGHAMLALYHVYPQAYQRFQSSPMLLPSALELAVVAELTDPQRGQAILDKMANVLQIGGEKVKTVPTSDHRKQYKIMAWPHAMAHWTIVGRYFIYSLGSTPIKLAIQAQQTPTYRLYAKTAPESLTAKHSNTIFLHLPNLMQAFNGLYIPLALKMTVSSFYLMNLKNMQTLLLSYRPGEEEMNLQGKIQLAPAPLPTPATPAKPDMRPGPTPRSNMPTP